MCNPQIAAVKGKKAGAFGHISQLRLHSIIDKILMAFEFLFGCWHRKLSRPFTLSGWTYEVCLNCGKKFAYDRAEIGFGAPKRQVGPRATLWHESRTRVSPVAEPQRSPFQQQLTY